MSPFASSSSSSSSSPSLRVAFLHPDLGIGGAERLVVDAAVALSRSGHRVRFFTSHHDPSHCFPETRPGGPDSLPVTVAGGWFPRSVLGRMVALCTYLRMVLAAIHLVCISDFCPDVIFCDQISACIPVLKLFSRAKVVFYCHFPDQLLTGRETRLKSAYRAPIDWLERRTTGMAHRVLVNSEFTAGVFRRTFPGISAAPEVLHPSLDTRKFDTYADVLSTEPFEEITFLSVNRYERKKNLGLAIKAFAILKKSHPDKNLKLVMAGGYDPRLEENIAHFSELEQLAAEEGLEAGKEVAFLKSPSEHKKLELLHRSLALLYTPSGEHFGIVPVEAMYCGLPVVAVADGGPRETVVDGQTGFLREATAEAFAGAMNALLEGGDELKRTMGKNGRRRVQENFSFQAFTESLNRAVTL